MGVRSIAQDRKITVYPDESLRQMVFAESALTSLSMSDIVSDALQKYYATMPKNKLNKIKAKVKVLESYPKKSA
jgi:hypothetical protein